ncbi:MAG: cation transporter, partial [Erysipelotrichaceae bacterium]|nr:cation transporter [Erysipelotrichaceae bacterium]
MSENPNQSVSAEYRQNVIIKTSVIGALANVGLAALNAVVGLFSHSIAAVLDGVKNLSEALLSVITIIGTKLARKAPDRKHPLGYGRVEYLSAMIISGLVLYAGITSAVESVKKIFHPTTPHYSTTFLAVIGAATVVKIVLGAYIKSQGEKVNSKALIASKSEPWLDASVLICALIFLATGISLEAYLGLLISAVIIKSAIGEMIETLNEILGARADKEIIRKIKSILTKEPEVRGAYDLILYNYGPEKDLASVHLELPDTMTVRQVDTLTRKVQSDVFRQTGVILAGVGVYSYNTGDCEAARIQNDVAQKVMAHDFAVEFHGFFIDTELKKMRFDVVMSFDIERQKGKQIIMDEIQAAYPDYSIYI